MNPLGVHALVFAGGWSRPEAERVTTGARRAGFDLVEIPVLEPRSLDLEMTRELLESSGLGAVCSLGLEPDTDIASEDADTAARGERVLLDALRVARELGASLLTGVTYGVLGRYRQPPTMTSRDSVRRILERVAARAADLGIMLGLEVVNRYENNLLNTSEQALELIEQIAAPSIRLHLDTYHMNIEEPGLVEPVLAAGDRLGYVHVSESHRGYLGTGNVDFPRFFGALAEIGYEGAITFESFSTAVVMEELSSTLCIWRNLWTDGDDLALHARMFISEQIEAGRRAPQPA
jgi:D-psicose/D-tagatose/L-ribulose 3-epimerase